MTPKVIHYCWFGRNPLPPLTKRCIKSWRRYLPDYEIKEWNEDNFDVSIIPYTREAYEAKKYAFVSDYARFWILYHYGGVYFDTDVEVIKPMDKLIQAGAFMGCENGYIEPTATDEATELSLDVAPGLGLGAEPGMEIYAKLLDAYSQTHFINEDNTINLKTVVAYTTEVLKEYGLKYVDGIQKCGGITIYPKEYFCPKNYITFETNITDKTYTIHHYDGSWLPPYDKFKRCIRQIFGKRLINLVYYIRRKCKR